MKNYLAFTIGPIYKTLLKARKTRELWISSFMFSHLMRLLLIDIEKKNIGKILIPDTNLLKDYLTFHGAGVFNDRCMIELFEGKTFSNDDYEELRKNIVKVFSGSFGSNPTLLIEPLKNYFQLYAVSASIDLEKLKTQEEVKARSVIFSLNKMMDDLERQTVYQDKESMVVDTIFNNVTEFYPLGFKDNHSDIRVFKDVKKIDRAGKQSNIPVQSLPSLVEICTKQLRIQKKIEFDKIVDPILLKGLSYLISEKKEELLDTDDTEIIQTLKKSFKTEFKTAHKYICIVNADGDSMGQCLGEIGNDWAKLDKFSRNLTNFSRMSSDIISKYGGHSVYIGGDDLFFLAPVLSTVEDKDQTIFDLIKDLDICFNKIWKENSIPDISVQTSMSYGLSITYYKYPLAEAITLSHHLLQDVAKSFPEKNALAVQVMHHSGQFSTTVFDKKASNSFDEFLALLKDFSNKESFINSVHDRIRSDQSMLNSIGLDDLVDFSGYFNNEYDIINMVDASKKYFIEQSIKIFASMYTTQKSIRKLKEDKLIKKGISDFSRIPEVEDEALSQLDTIYRLLNFLIRTDND